MKKASLLVMVFVIAAVAWTPSCSFLKDFKYSVKQEARSSGKAVDLSKLPDEPQVTFKDLQGADVPLSSLKGKVLLINFWATWCEPCLEEIPWMIGFQQKYASRGFTVLGVAMDDEGKSAVEPFIQKHLFDVGGQSMGMNYPIVLGNDDIGQKFGGLIGLPTSVVISRDGKIVKRFIGMPNRDLLSSEVEGLL